MEEPPAPLRGRPGAPRTRRQRALRRCPKRPRAPSSRLLRPRRRSSSRRPTRAFRPPRFRRSSRRSSWRHLPNQFLRWWTPRRPNRRFLPWCSSKSARRSQRWWSRRSPRRRLHPIHTTAVRRSKRSVRARAWSRCRSRDESGSIQTWSSFRGGDARRVATDCAHRTIGHVEVSLDPRANRHRATTNVRMFHSRCSDRAQSPTRGERARIPRRTARIRRRQGDVVRFALGFSRRGARSVLARLATTRCETRGSRRVRTSYSDPSARLRCRADRARVGGAETSDRIEA